MVGVERKVDGVGKARAERNELAYLIGTDMMMELSPAIITSSGMMRLYKDAA